MSKDNSKPNQEMRMSRRGFPKHLDNPSIAVAAENQIVALKPALIGTKDNCMIITGDSKIDVAAGFYQKKAVDQTQFMKLYMDGMKAAIGLSPAGKKIFEIIYENLRDKEMKKPNKDDLLILHYDIVGVDRMSRATFDRGITELLKKEILYESMSTNAYFVNINMFFNGNRMTFINEYYLEKSPEWIEQDLPL